MSDEPKFLDARWSKPGKDHVLAKYTAMADIVDEGPPHVKRDIVNYLTEFDGGQDSAMKIMERFCGASEKESVRVLLEMCKDLDSGMAKEEVLAKPYRYQCEFLYYCKKEDVPPDPHWSTITLIQWGNGDTKAT